MNFLNPYLLFGLMGAAVPLLIHLLNRFRPKVVQWAAMDLLRRVMLTKSRRIRIEDLIILLLRTFAIAVLALAIARPTLTARSGALGATPGVVIAIDASMSMMHRPGTTSRFDQAIDRAKEILNTLEPGDPATILLLGARPRILLRNTGYNYELFDTTLRDAAPLPEPLNIDNGLDEIIIMLDELKAASRECYIITDAQTGTWRNPGARVLSTLREISQRAALLVVAVDASQSENLAVTDLQHVSGMLRHGSTARYRAAISNTGANRQTGVRVRLTVNDTTVDHRTIEQIGPGETMVVPMFATFSAHGAARISAMIDIQDDPLEIDNQRHLSAGISSGIRVLCITGGAISDGPNRTCPETIFLAKALQAQPPGSQALQAAGAHAAPVILETIPSHSHGAAAGFSRYDIIILVNVPDLPERSVAGLYEFVEAGGSLVAFLGGNVSASVANERMRRNGTYLFGAELIALSEERSPEEQGWQVIVSDSAHSLGRSLSVLPAPTLSEASVFRYHTVKPSAGAHVILRSGDSADPLLLEKEIGSGRVLLFTSTADRQWNNLPLNPAYPILLNDMLTYLMRRAWERPAEVGSQTAVTLQQDGRHGTATLTAPNGDSALVRIARRSGVDVAELPEIAMPGFYRLQTEIENITIAANIDPRQSDVTAMETRELAQVLHDSRARILDSNALIDAEIQQVRIGIELWRYLLIIAAFLFAAESILARRFSREIRHDDNHVDTRAVLPREMP